MTEEVPDNWVVLAGMVPSDWMLLAGVVPG